MNLDLLVLGISTTFVADIGSAAFIRRSVQWTICKLIMGIGTLLVVYAALLT